MRAAKAMVRDWSFWLYLGFMLVMLASVRLLSSQHGELMEVHHRCLRTLETILSRSAIAAREHRLMEREIQALERREEAPPHEGGAEVSELEAIGLLFTGNPGDL